MTFYLVAWVWWTCPGGWLSGSVPPKLWPLVCEESANTATFDRLEQANEQADKLGPQRRPRIWQYKGLRRSELPVTFNPGTRR